MCSGPRTLGVDYSLAAPVSQDGLNPTNRKDKVAVGEARELASDLGADIQYVNKHELNLLSHDRPHQVHHNPHADAMMQCT